MDEYKSIEHALHNEKVCDVLHKHKDFKDWVITTSFYSAIHFISHKLFPLKVQIDGKTITVTSFENYCLVNNIIRGKHGAFSRLVEEKLSEISNQYNHLKDMSWTARYHRYKFDESISRLARQRLIDIKKACS
jgi:hypothetical protein